MSVVICTLWNICLRFHGIFWPNIFNMHNTCAKWWMGDIFVFIFLFTLSCRHLKALKLKYQMHQLFPLIKHFLLEITFSNFTLVIVDPSCLKMLWSTVTILTTKMDFLSFTVLVFLTFLLTLKKGEVTTTHARVIDNMSLSFMT